MTTKIEPPLIRNILLVTRDGGQLMLNLPYYNPLEVDPHMLAALLRAILLRGDDEIGRIAWRDNTICFALRERVVGILITKALQEDHTYRHMLQDLVDRVETRLDDNPAWVQTIEDGRFKPLTELAIDVVCHFPLKDIDIKLHPIRTGVGVERVPFLVGNLAKRLEIALECVDNKRTIEDILDIHSDISDEGVIALLSILERWGVVEFVKIPTLNDRLSKECDLGKSDPAQLGLGGYALDWTSFLNAFDGSRDVSEVADELGIDKSVVLFIVRKLVDKGFLCFAPSE